MFRFLFFISLVFALGILIFSCSGSVEEDRAALIALYNATDGDNWKDNTNWLSNKPLKEWSGVRINGQGRVDMLVLHENFLSGAIPPELGNLSHLQALSLYSNRELSGSIPPELGNLSNLEILFLSDNQLSGSIPPELGKLSNLERLFLVGNQLSGSIPPELGKLSNLERLFLMDNQLSGAIPSELGNLSNLVQVFLSGNPNLCMPVALKDWRHYYTAGVAKCFE